MIEFFNALFAHTFMQNAFLAGTLASLACGMAGTYVVVKRISYISGGIAHTVLGGMGIAYYLGINPLIGAIVFALLSAVILGLVSLKAKQHEDTIIGALWAVGMAIGVIFIFITPGYKVDLTSFLFGNILFVSRGDLGILFGLNLLILAMIVLFYRQFQAICFDEDYARLRGVAVEIIYVLLLCLIALTVVVLIQVVGLILVIALLTLPASIAGLGSRKLGRMMVGATLFSLVFTMTGLILSYLYNLPAGATIIIIAGIGYLKALGLRSLIRSKTKSRSLKTPYANINAKPEQVIEKE